MISSSSSTTTSSDNSDNNEPVAKKIKKRKYAQKYKEAWENLPQFRLWLKSSAKQGEFAYCKICERNLSIKSGKDSLIKHASTALHAEKCKQLVNQPAISTFLMPGKSNAELEKDKKIKEGEIRMAAFIAENNLPFTVMDRLPKLGEIIYTDSKYAKGISCGRTKTAAIIKNVLGRYSFEQICQELRQKKFSLIVDESTDRSTVKHLCLVVRYINETNYVQDAFLGLIPLCSADAVTLYNHIIQFFDENGIPYKKNMIGFASDGANVMLGSKNSLMVLLKRDIPSLFVMKCICHSFHLCASYACEKLPRFVEDLTRDIYNYFSSSPKRIAEYVEFQKFCHTKIHKILHPSQTRWLSVQAVVSRILEQYRPLQLFFTDAVANNDVLATDNILKKLNDPTTKLFLQFLEFTLPFFNNLNKEMQSQSPKLYKLHRNICQILKSIFDCFLKREYINKKQLESVEFSNPSNFLKLEAIYLGANVSKSLLEINLSTDQLQFFRLRCLDFYIEACNQITKRFPLKDNIVKLFNFMDPKVIKNASISSIAEVAVLFPNLIKETDLQMLDTEWRLLRNTENINSFPNDAELFWQEVKQIKLGDGTLLFRTLSNFAFNILSLPHSSANVERIFSSINLMKTKQRNKLSTDAIIGLLHTKRYLNNQSSHSFKIEEKLISYMQKDMYKKDLACASTSSASGN